MPPSSSLPLQPVVATGPPPPASVASLMPPSSSLPLQPVVATGPPPPASVASIIPPSSTLPLQPVVATGPPSSPRDRTIYDEETQRGPPPNNIVIEELGTDDEGVLVIMV